MLLGSRADPAVRQENKQRDTASYQLTSQDPATRRGRNTATHQLARADSQCQAQEQQMNNARQYQVSVSRLPSLMVLNYQPDNFHNTIDIGTLSVECSHCGALKFPGETDSFCCSKGNVQPEPVSQPQPFLQHLYEGTDSDSKHFKNNIRKYNSND